MHYAPYLTSVVPPRKSKSEVEVSMVDVEPSQIVVDPKVMSSPGVITRIILKVQSSHNCGFW